MSEQTNAKKKKNSHGTRIKKYPWSEIGKHKKRGDCWLVVDGNIYDVSQFNHPGGWPCLVRASKTDATQAFFAVDGHESDTTEEAMDRMWIGEVRAENEKDEDEEEKSPLEDRRRSEVVVDTGGSVAEKGIDLDESGAGTRYILVVVLAAIGFCVVLYYLLR